MEASLPLSIMSEASIIDDAQYSDCLQIEKPEIKRICQRLTIAAYNPTIRTGSVRGIRSGDPITLRSFLASDGLGELGKLEAFNQFLVQENLPMIGTPGLTKLTDDINLGRWQPMRGKRGDKLYGRGSECS